VLFHQRVTASENRDICFMTFQAHYAVDPWGRLMLLVSSWQKITETTCILFTSKVTMASNCIDLNTGRWWTLHFSRRVYPTHPSS